MSRVEVVRNAPDRLRFMAYNTFCEIVLSQAPEQAVVWEPVLETARQVQRMLDAYDEASEVSSLRHTPKNQPVHLSDGLFVLLKTLLAVGIASNGAFDITVGGLSKLWDFAGDKPRCPRPERISQALAQTGQHLLSLNEANHTLTFLHDGVSLDVGAAGKGYAAERLARTLREMGIQHASVNLGGNLYLLGDSPHGGTWSIGVQMPWERRGLVVGELHLNGNAAVSTSGGYDRFFVENGRVWHHLLDPRTGSPVENNLLSCTIVCSDAMMSDVLSTVLFVGGEDCMRHVAHAVCPHAFTGYVLMRSDGAVVVSDELEDVYMPI